MDLRKYQVDLINKVRESYKSGHKAPCIVLPCGGGKSIIVAEMARKTTQNGKRVLFIVHRKELCDQIRKTFTGWGVDMSLCQIMMVQTVCKHLNMVSEPALIITDENHHSKAKSYIKVYERFPKAYRVGVTATPVRLDGSGLKDVNDDLVVGVNAKWLIENKFLAPYKYFAPSLVDLSGIKLKQGDFDAVQVEQLMLKKAIFGDVISYYKNLADGKQAICYCATINYSKAMADSFIQNGISAAHIDGKTPKDERDEVIEKFRKGEIKILCNVDLISEGFDVPDCECAILLRPTQSLTLYIQQSMRCMRYKPNKTAVIIDHVGNYARHGMPDDSREWSLESKKKKQQKQKVKISSGTKLCPNCHAVFPEDDLEDEKEPCCPFCGELLPAPKRQIEEVKEAKLMQIDDFFRNYDSPSKCRNYKELLAFAKRHGYKKGWAYYQAKERGFEYPVYKNKH